GQVIYDNEDAVVKLKLSYELLIRYAGGEEDVVFIKQDQKNHLGATNGEATYLYEHFNKEKDKDAMLYYEVEVDSCEQIANIFWADREMRRSALDFHRRHSVDVLREIEHIRHSIAELGVDFGDISSKGGTDFRYLIDENVAREIINHRSLRHHNIIRFKEAISLQVVLTPSHLAIVMEYAAGGELFERIWSAGRFSEDETDKASMLDEVIEHLKQVQMQVQIWLMTGN
ncbi:unnamed protein product, partial [Linum tenue]